MTNRRNFLTGSGAVALWAALPAIPQSMAATTNSTASFLPHALQPMLQRQYIATENGLRIVGWQMGNWPTGSSLTIEIGRILLIDETTGTTTFTQNDLNSGFAYQRITQSLGPEVAEELQREVHCHDLFLALES